VKGGGGVDIVVVVRAGGKGLFEADVTFMNRGKSLNTSTHLVPPVYLKE
jgi:hypothetical protein